MIKPLSVATFLWSLFWISAFARKELTKNNDDIIMMSVSFANDFQGRILQSLPNGKPFYSFESIPYAKPPVGELRFKPPEKLCNRPNIDGTKSSPICPQWKFRNTHGLSRGPLLGQEDCLYLNVFVPEAHFDQFLENRDIKVPVMVWIHGGRFLAGSSSRAFHGPHYFMDQEDVILVTINYRLGALGWMSLNDEVLSGNMGLLDQVQALQWIQENIESNFGGDKNRVVIFGESAGAISVLWHLMSPASKGLFHKVIAQSGPVVASSPMHLSQPASVYGRRFAQSLSCVGTNRGNDEVGSNEILECLQNKPLEEIMEASRGFEQFTLMPNHWKPIIDRHSPSPVLCNDPWEVFQSGSFNQVPVMLGGTYNEGCIYLIQFLMHPDKVTRVNEEFDRFAPLLFLGTDGEMALKEEVELAQDLLKTYTNSTRLDLQSWKSIESLFSDVIFLASIDLAAQHLARTAKHPVYYYNFRYKGETSLADLFGYDTSKGDLGVCHADDLFVLFHQDNLTKSSRDEDMTMKMVRTWINFAKDTIPDPNWKMLANDKEPEFAILDDGDIRMASGEEMQNFRKRISYISEKLKSLQRIRLRTSKPKEKIEL